MDFDYRKQNGKIFLFNFNWSKKLIFLLNEISSNQLKWYPKLNKYNE